MPDTGQGISVGDAVLTFFGDTTKLDASFAKVQTSATMTSGAIDNTFANLETKAAVSVGAVSEVGVAIKEIPPVSPIVPASIDKVTYSAYEAKGEVRLLGEAVGVHMPRHVASFVATLPGVGAALSAAFAVTAVGFLLSALVQVTEKLSNFIAELEYGVKAANDVMAQTAALNKVLEALQKQYDETKKKADDYGKSALQLANESKTQVEKSIKDLTKEFSDERAEITKLTAATQHHLKMTLSVGEAYSEWRAGTLTFTEALKRMTVGFDEADDAQKKLFEMQGKAEETAKKLDVAHQSLRVATHGVTDAQKKLDEEYAKAEKEYEKTKAELVKLNAEMKKLADVQASVVEITMASLPPMVKEYLALGAALRTVGLDTVDLEAKLKKEQLALGQVEQAYLKGSVSLHDWQQAQLHVIQTEIALAKAHDLDTKALEHQELILQKSLGIDKQKEKSYDRLTRYDKIYTDEVKAGATKQQAAWRATQQAMLDTVAAYAMGSASIEQSLAKMLQAELATLAQKAMVKSIEQLAEAWGSYPDGAGMAAHFTAAAGWAALGGGLAAAGNMLSGSTGAPGTAAGNPINITNGGGPATQAQPQPVQTVNAQHFAEGALISEPTLALMGEGRRKEGVLPLEDPEAMGKIAEAITRRMSPPDHAGITVNVKGMISPDNLGKVIQKINKRVHNRQSNLLASNSYRLTRRSQ